MYNCASLAWHSPHYDGANAFNSQCLTLGAPRDFTLRSRWPFRIISFDQRNCVWNHFKRKIEILNKMSSVVFCIMTAFMWPSNYYSDVIMSVIASRITGVMSVYSTVCSGADERKHQGPAALAFVRPSQRARNVENFPFDDVIVVRSNAIYYDRHINDQVRI